MSARLRASLICSTSEPTLEGLLARCTALAITRMRPDDASLLNGWVHQAAAEFDLIMVACPVVEVSRPLWDKLVHSRVPVIALCREEAVGQLAVETGATEYLEWDLLTPHALERFAALIVAARSRRSETDPSSLQENTLALSTAVEQSPVSIVITDSDGRIEYVNPKFTRLTGYTFSDVAGHNPRLLKSGHTTPAEYAALWASIKSGREWRGEFLNRKKSGELYWEEASISPVRDSANRITHFVAVKEDITARKYSEAQVARLNEQLEANVRERTAQLQTMHQRIAAVSGSTSDAIVMIDQNDRIEISNPAFARTFQYAAEEIRGASLHVLVESDQHAVFTRALQLTRASGQGGHAEVRACRKDGTIFDASCAFGNVVENGYIVCSMRDITPLKESERLKDRFVSMVNHELRTPLTAIMLSADTLLTYSDRMDEEKRHGKLLQIRDQGTDHDRADRERAGPAPPGRPAHRAGLRLHRRVRAGPAGRRRHAERLYR
ncbi:MAG: PAS domain S-box protein [Chloroflexi bacterium]|nr:PAS domain S-box protein [Chloroflexota bacterium]